ncbi:MAG TPA: phosphoenolpyruvate--protein phosphotransferase [Candidatus Cloacimonetes bacterium]|nr:phosphoenolpyruvate--protein phosphotransferase [Candidatus Cloacimonadota bacterium]HEX38220.1 phosphoenolpyruvate--protein phosphotransferase [Candidatus Cloacimonadota bacterium]
MEKLKGSSVASGIIAGKVTVVKSNIYQVTQGRIDNNEIDEQIQQFQDSIKHAIKEVDLMLSYLETHAKNEREILISHKEMLKDEVFIEEVITLIQEKLFPADLAVQKYIDSLVNRLNNLDDEFLVQRKEDFEDIKTRIIRNLHQKDIQHYDKIKHERVVVISEIIPSLLLTIKNTDPLALIAETGSMHSHSAIIAKSLGIPVIFNIHHATKTLHENDFVIVNGDKGEVIKDPTPEQLEKYKEIRKEQQKKLKEKISLLKQPIITKDRVPVELMGNIEFPEECDADEIQYADGIGLFRTEFLYFLDNTFPSAEKQAVVYKKVISSIPEGKPIYVRVFDVGGDKLQREFGLHKEKNPNLGCRGIRFLLKYKEIFRQQIRGILMASSLGNIKIILPMISSREEIIRSRKIIQDEMRSLEEENIPFNKNISVGIMVEIPSSALLAHEFADVVDFFSIGTNDLTQYVLAADRNNEALSDDYTYFHPAVRSLIEMVIRAGSADNIEVKMCGEMASDPAAVALLLGMGLRSFSANINKMVEVKKIIQSYTIPELEELYQKHRKASQEEMRNIYGEFIA